MTPAAVHYHLNVTHAPSGRNFETDIADIIRFEDGRIAEFTQFVDTALAASLGG